MAKRRKKAKKGANGTFLFLALMFVVLCTPVTLVGAKVFPFVIGLLVLACSIYFFVWWRRKKKRLQYSQKLRALYGNNAAAVDLMHTLNGILALEKHHIDAETKRKKRDLLEEYRRKFAACGSGYVYFVRDSSTGYIKIGKAVDPYERIARGFGAKMPFKLEVAYLIKTNNDYGTENLFHRLFHEKRVNGEWFALSAEDVAWVKSGNYPADILQSIVGK